MNIDWTGFIVGALFGSGLFLAGLAEPDKIVGTLRLKDFHAMRTIAVFVLVGMLGVWILELAGAVHFSVKPTVVASLLVGGALLGIGFGMTGYCPGTGLACAAAGRLDALVTVLGMFAGALVYIWIYPSAAMPLEKIGNYGKIMLPDVTILPRWLWVIGISIVGFWILWATRSGKGGCCSDSKA